MKQFKLMLVLIMVFPLHVNATDFSTSETVRFVLACMADMGGLNDENLYTCTCKHDAVAANMSFSDYEEGLTFERNRDMPGEKGSSFRDNERAEKYFERLIEVREIANSECITVKSVKRDTPTTK